MKKRSRKQKAQPFGKLLKGTVGVRELIWELVTNEKRLTWGYRILLLCYLMVIAGAVLGLVYGGIKSAKTETTGPSKLASSQCGYWTFDEDSGSEEQARLAAINDLIKEERAAQYAENCYRYSSSFDASRCNFLYRQKLEFESDYTTDCPFSNDICLENQTVTFTTPITDGGDLGINDPDTHKFRRNTKCTPLSIEHPYVQNETENGITTYYYYYGEKAGENYTYKTVGDPWDRLAPVYDVYAYGSNIESTDGWKPRAELSHPEYSTVTIIFVSSLRILYKKRSDDPIFPADLEVLLPGDKKSAFRNSDPRARPLACINTIEICTTDGSKCWAYGSPDDTNEFEKISEFVFVA